MNDLSVSMSTAAQTALPEAPAKVTARGEICGALPEWAMAVA